MVQALGFAVNPQSSLKSVVTVRKFAEIVVEGGEGQIGQIGHRRRRFLASGVAELAVVAESEAVTAPLALLAMNHSAVDADTALRAVEGVPAQHAAFEAERVVNRLGIGAHQIPHGGCEGQ